jgi:hypothetical protein
LQFYVSKLPGLKSQRSIDEREVALFRRVRIQTPIELPTEILVLDLLSQMKRLRPISISFLLAQRFLAAAIGSLSDTRCAGASITSMAASTKEPTAVVTENNIR